MAEARVSVNLDQFSCPICLELLKDPVSIPCGHSFCMTCIKTKWDQDDQTGDYSCPLCRKTSTLRPDLGRNTVLAEMVEKLKNAHIAYRTLAGPEDVSCDVCIGQKCKAVKSCLKCLASYCRIHFNLHNELNPGNKHRMIDTKYNLAERICCAHDTLKDFFCHTEQEMVCCECIVNLCRGHKTTTLASERFSKLRMLGTIQTQFQQRTQETENKLKQLKKTKQSIKTFTKRILDQSEKIFSDLISLIERKRSKIMEMIRATEKAEVYRTEEILKSLEKEVEKLKQRDIEMAQLPHLEDDFLFFKTSKSLFDFSTLAHGPDITVNMSIFEGIQNTVSKIKEKVVILQQTELSKMLQTVKTAHIVQTSNPVIREDFLKYFCELTLDPSTAYKYLHFSEGNRKITCDERIYQPRHENLERFNYFAQVLSTQAFCDRCYWEVEWGGQQVCIAATYRVDTRNGCCANIGFGYNDRSWSLFCNPFKYVFCHNSKHTVISGPVSKRIGIYLNYRSGTLSFYSITHTMTLLHRVQTTFTEALYPGFWVFDYSNLKICGRDAKVIPQIVSRGSKTYLVGYQFILESNTQTVCSVTMTT